MGAGRDDLLGEAQVVVEGVQALVRVGQVGGVAEGDLGDRGARLPYGLDGGPHLADVVERVEDAEDVDAGGGGLLHEGVGHLGRVRGVADGVAAAQQHLQTDVGDGLAQGGQAFPGVLGQEAQRHVVRRAAPALQGQQLGQGAGDHGGDREEVLGAYPGGEQGLVGVAEGGVGDADGRRLAQRAGEALRAEFDELLPGARGRLARRQRGQLGAGLDQFGPLAVRLVDRHVGEVREQLGAAVGGGAGGQQVGALLDERGRDPAGLEVGVVQHRLQEGDVGGHAADAELGHGTPGPADRGLEVPAPAGEFDQHGVEVGADLRTGMGGSAVEADARAAGRAVGADAAGVRAEAVGGVLGGDTALKGRAVQLDRVLGQPQVGETLAGGDTQLGLDEVDVGDLLGHRVLDLDARVHLDEDVVAVAVEEELHGARVAVADLAGEAHGVGADPVP